MSTQSSSFPAIPLTHTQPQQAFRLLELPPALLELLSSDNAPTLYVKSSNPPTTPVLASPSITPRAKGVESGYVHLCTPTQTYQVRQVSTSNSLFVTQPTRLLPQNPLTGGHNGETDAEHDDGVTLPATGALTVIGQVGSVMELQPVQLDTRALLKALMPVWQWSDMIMPKVQRNSNGALTKRQYFNQIPAPDGQIEKAWRELFAFQLQGRHYVPDHETLYQAWKQAMHQFQIDGAMEAVMGPESFFNVGNAPEDNMDDDESEVLNVVMKAIWWSPLLRKPTETAFELDETKDIDPVMTTVWLGRLVLQHMTPGGELIDVEQFMTSWRNLLPEKWDSGVVVEALGEEYYQLETTVYGVKMIRWAGAATDGTTHGAVNEKGGLENMAKEKKAGSGTGSKRKWHEKFKASRG